MSTDKFNEDDRAIAISQVEEHFAVKLSRGGDQRKVLRDSFGRIYWVLGGYGEWHGITGSMLSEAVARNAEDILVIAKREPRSIESFYGPLQPLLTNREMLSHTQSGDHQFNITISGGLLTLAQVPSLTLHTMGVAPAPDSVEAALAKWSVEELVAELARRRQGV